MSDVQETLPSVQPQGSSEDSQKGVNVFNKRISVGALAAWIGVFALLALLAFGLLRSQRGPVAIGEEVPDFTLTTFEGEQISLEELKGKVVVVNFWASWCKPCEEEAADLEAAWRIYQPRGDVVFLGVDYVDSETEAMIYLEKFDITYPNGPDLKTKISQAFRVRGVPETYLIDKDGKLASFKISPFVSLAEIQGMIDPLLDS